MANKKLIYCTHLQTGPGPLSTSACCATIRTMWSIVAWATGSMGWIEIMVHLDNNCYCITIAIGRQQKRAFWCTIIDSLTSGERCCGKFFKMSTYQSREFGSSFPTSYLLIVFTKRRCNQTSSHLARALRAVTGAVTGRQCPHSGVGEDFLRHRPFFSFTKTSVTRKQKVKKSILRCEMNSLSKGYKRAFDNIWGRMAIFFFGFWSQKQSFRAQKKLPS